MSSIQTVHLNTRYPPLLSGIQMVTEHHRTRYGIDHMVLLPILYVYVRKRDIKTQKRNKLGLDMEASYFDQII